MIIVNDNAVVLTGGPGACKTSLIDRLKREGYNRMAESGRDIIRLEMESGGNKLPWGDQVGFAQEMFQRAMVDFDNALATAALTFFDRGIPDIIGYLQLSGLPVPDEMWQAANKCRYFEKVFVTPPWKEIFEADAERKQTYREAVDTYQAMQDVYTRLGYALVSIPLTDIDQRARFVMGNLV